MADDTQAAIGFLCTLLWSMFLAVNGYQPGSLAWVVLGVMGFFVGASTWSRA